MAIDWSEIKKQYLHEWASSQRSGQKAVNASAFAKKVGISRTQLNKYRGKWEAELEANVERLKPPALPVDEDLNPNIKTMDNLRLMAALEGSDINPEDKALWIKLGIDDYAGRLAKVFTAVSKGSPIERAIRYGGITKKEYDRLRDRVPIIQHLYEEAVSKYEVEVLDRMWKLSEKDHKSAAFLLERHEALRDYYSPKEDKQQIEIRISIERNAPIIEGVVDAEIIDGNN